MKNPKVRVLLSIVEGAIMVALAQVLGYLKLWDTLRERHPGLWVDSCASGGRRNDLESMRRGVPLHYTDVGYGNHPIKQMQHRLHFEWIPYFRALIPQSCNPGGSFFITKIRMSIVNTGIDNPNQHAFSA